jgi:hypothetical protein
MTIINLFASGKVTHYVLESDNLEPFIKEFGGNFKNTFTRSSCCRTMGCAGTYWGEYFGTVNSVFIFGFPYMWWATHRLINEINSRAENFKIKIHYKNNGYVGEIKNDFGAPNITGSMNREDSGWKKCWSYIFELETSKDYSSRARQYLTYAVHHTLRFCSLPENYISYDEVPKKGKTLEHILNRNSDYHTQTEKYRAISEVPLTVNEWYLLDDVKVMNALGANFEQSRQSKIFRAISIYAKQGNFNPIEPGTLVYISDEHVRYSGYTVGISYEICSSDSISYSISTKAFKTNPLKTGELVLKDGGSTRHLAYVNTIIPEDDANKFKKLFQSYDKKYYDQFRSIIINGERIKIGNTPSKETD